MPEQENYPEQNFIRDMTPHQTMQWLTGENLNTEANQVAQVESQLAGTTATTPELIPASPVEIPLETILPKATITMLKSNPEHPSFRAMVMARIGRKIPDELKTFEDISRWIKTAAATPLPTVQPLPPLDPFTRGTGATEATRADAGGITIHVTVSETEIGTANYTAQAQGSGELNLTGQQIISACLNNENLDQALEEINDVIHEEANNHIVTGRANGTLDYDNHERDETDGTEVNYDETTLHNLVREYLRINRPDVLHDLEAGDYD